MDLSPQTSAAALSLLSSAAVRARAHELLEVGLGGQLPHFSVNGGQLPQVADFVAEVMRTNYPSLRIPLHARWRHFSFQGRDLWRDRASQVAWATPDERAHAEFDLAIVSVLLDAGAGADWRYQDLSGLHIGRSEGLALASLRMFEAGLFSANPQIPMRVDAERLTTITSQELSDGFQIRDNNPMTGIDGRVALLNRLGQALLANRKVFAGADTPRPGGLFDHLKALGRGHLPAATILSEVLINLGPIWPSRITLDGVALGDTWRHSAIKRDDATDGLMPLHKLSQWLTYSLIEPLQTAGVIVTDFDALTGLAEYRNGGLFVDMDVLVPRDASILAQSLDVDSEAVVEWRALTVALLDRIAPLVRQRLGATAAQMPLGSVLEGGTWAAGRKIARERRADGGPPLTIASDGTVF